ncbi:MAG: monovalent cation/H(+) antiporter subunit G [Betaproteobacteria bacterium]|jgi:multicomponent Na+:H+ antiporter subunit G|nr:monovalent cation/H(+) antiporter subunit G [Betaproteobacteria bacterium]
MTVAAEWLGWIFLGLGSFFCVVGGLGLVRMPDFYTRMHAASVTDTLGAGLMLLGMMFVAGISLVTVKLIVIGFLLFFTSPTATHALAKAGMHRGLEPRLARQRPEEEVKPSNR